MTRSTKTDSMYTGDLLQYCTTVKLFEPTAPTNEQHQYRLYPYQMKKYISREAASYVSSGLKNQSFDVVHAEGYYLLQHVSINCGIPIILIEHNVEHILALQRFLLARRHKDKSYFWSEYLKTLRWEKFMWKRATVCIALTREDKNTIEQQVPSIDVRTIPNGSDHHKMIEQTSLYNGFEDNEAAVDNCPSILFIGNFAYEPNVDGALYFCRDIFPIILKAMPNVRLYLVGNAPPSEIRSLTSNRQIKVTGRVDSVIPFYKQAQVVVCPLRIGGGVKVKVLEALYLGKAVVSTSIGAQGLDLSNYRALTVADDESDFAEKVIQFLLHPEKRRMQEQEALDYARTLPTWDQVSDAFAQLYKEIADSRVTKY